MCLVSHCPCQLNRAESALFCKKKSEICTLAKSRRLMPVPWKPLQTLRKLKLKISRTLWTCACAFSPDLLALMLDYTPSVPPLPPLKYGSDGRKGQSQYGGGSSGRDGWEGGGLCVTLNHPWHSQAQRRENEGEGGWWWWRWWGLVCSCTGKVLLLFYYSFKIIIYFAHLCVFYGVRCF